MKKSLIWRFAIIFTILGAWTYSLFPLTDKPFYDALEKEAGDRSDAKLQQLISEAQKNDNSNPGSHLSPAKAIINAADHAKVNLRDYVPIYNQPTASNESVVNYVRRRSAGKLRLGLDLRGGTEFIIGYSPEELQKNDPEKQLEEARDEIIEIMRNRVDQSGIIEAQITPTGPNTISVKIPSIDADDIKGFRDIIQATAKLDFRLVNENNEELVSQESNPDFQPPIDYERLILKNDQDANSTPTPIYVKRFAEAIGGRHIKRATATVNELGTYSVSLEFNMEGAQLFHEVTSANVGRRLAIVLDGKVYSAPNINEAISGGRAEISGNFSPEEANKLAVVLRCGNLPVPIKIEGEFSTDPTLGRSSVAGGINACIVGTILVIVFMTIYYHTSGIIANLALIANVLLVLGTLTIAGATITLPGIAGIVLTIGMAVDANVLIFERMREEILNKKSITTVIEQGYHRAFSAIIDSNITTFFAAIIMYYYGSGPIRGFAVTLSIGIIASMFTSLFMTKAIFDFLLHKNLLTKITMMQAFRFKDKDFLKYAKPAIIFSAIMISLTFVTLVVRGKNALSVDFRGGTAVTFNYEKEIPAHDILTALASAGIDEVRVSYKSSPVEATRLVEIVVGAAQSNQSDIKEKIQEKLNAQFPEAKFHQGTTKFIGGVVGHRFFLQATLALFWSFVSIIAYVTLRFEFSRALGILVCLIHDVIICTGVLLIANLGDRQISLAVISGLLTIVGYSLNDTIVIYDRIRENVGLYKNMNFIDLVNLSINQTLSRTILTSFTVLLTVLSLYFMGGGEINDFALVMLTGVITGTYSTIFIAAPVMVAWQQHRSKKISNSPSTPSSNKKTNQAIA